MSSSAIAVFSDIHDLQAALSSEAPANLVLTRGGRFYARLAQIGLPQITVWRVDENLPRIAFIDNNEEKFLISFSNSGSSQMVWAGLAMDPNQMISVGPRERLHVRSLGPCQWNAIWFSAVELARYGRSVLGADVMIPDGICRWTIPHVRIRQLRQLTGAAASSITRHPQPLVTNVALHGLEQEIIHQLMKCIGSATVAPGSRRWRLSHQTAVNAEDLVTDTLGRELRAKDACTALGVSHRRLREDCATHLGLGFAPYKKLKRLEAARQTLSKGRDTDITVAAVAHQFGFRHAGQFARLYQELFGELPSVTTSRGPRRSLPQLSLRQRASGAA